jgi:gamma-glutamyltranspeptidase/glutathione hydrolase
VDKAGNAVAVTYTLNTNFGSGIVAKGTGILLNNEMDDFSAKPGVANAYGLVGDANAVAAGKRPLSSMTPTWCSRTASPLVTGSPGGARIITTVLQTVVNTHRLRHEPRRGRRHAALSPPVDARRAAREKGFSPTRWPCSSNGATTWRSSPRWAARRPSRSATACCMALRPAQPGRQTLGY